MLNSRSVLAVAAGIVLVAILYVSSEILKSQQSLILRLAKIELKQEKISKALPEIQKSLPEIQKTLRGLQRASGNVMAQKPSAPPSEDPNKVYTIDVGSSSVLGNKDAKITIVEFSDFQCPYSQRFHPVVGEVLKSYPNDVNYVLKNYPLSFHPNARPAAKASLAAGEQGKYWEMTEALFQNGKELSEEKYKELAKDLGLDVDKFTKDLAGQDEKWEKLIAEDMATAGKADVRGTPTFFINGKKTHARDLAAFKVEVEEILKGKSDTK